MNSPFDAIVPWYALVVQRTVMWSRYQFTDFTRLKQLSPCIIIHNYVAVCVVTHNGMNPGAAIVTRPSQWRQVFDHSPKRSHQGLILILDNQQASTPASVHQTLLKSRGQRWKGAQLQLGKSPSEDPLMYGSLLLSTPSLCFSN